MVYERIWLWLQTSWHHGNLPIAMFHWANPACSANKSASQPCSVYLTRPCVRSSCSRCSPSSSMMSLPIWSVSAAIRWLRSMLAEALLSDAVPWMSKARCDCRWVCKGEWESEDQEYWKHETVEMKDTLYTTPNNSCLSLFAVVYDVNNQWLLISYIVHNSK